MKAILTALACATIALVSEQAPDPAPAVVTIDRGQSVSIDPPSRLDVRGMSRAECLDSGGRPRGDLCVDVDY